MRPSWLTERATVEAMESLWKILRKHPQWQEWKANMNENDELWRFSSPPKTWPAKLGAAGVALVRDGKIVGYITVLRS